MKKRVLTLLFTVAFLSLVPITLNNYTLDVHAASTVSMNLAVDTEGNVWDLDEATKLSNDYATGYLYDDGTLLVTKFEESSINANDSNYPWNNYKTTITKILFSNKGIKFIGQNAFDAFSNLGDTNLIIPEGVLDIYKYAFRGVKSTGYLTFPSTLQTIGDNAFDGAKFTGTLDLPDGLQSIGGGAFQNCTGFTGILRVPGSVETIQANTFNKCTGFTGIELGNGIKTLIWCCFSNCTGMRGDLIFPDSMEAVSYRAFENSGPFNGTLRLSPLIINDNASTTFTLNTRTPQFTKVIVNGAFETFNMPCVASEIEFKKNLSVTLVKPSTLKSIVVTTSPTYDKAINTDYKSNNYLPSFKYINTLDSKAFSITGKAEVDIITLDITIPVDPLTFNIDEEGNLTSQGLVIKSNTNVPLEVNVLSIEQMDRGDTTDGLEATNIKALKLVNRNMFTDEQWNNLSIADTRKYISLALKQTDVVVDDEGNYSASYDLLDMESNPKAVTDPVYLDEIYTSNQLLYIPSAYNSEQVVAFNIDRENSRCGKMWVGTEKLIFRYSAIFEFSYEME